MCVRDQTCCTCCLVDVHEIHRLDDGLEREGLEVAQKVLEVSPLHCRWRKPRRRALSLLGGFLHTVFGPIGWRDLPARVAYGL